MSGFQNTKQRYKDTNTPGASTTLTKHDLVVSANAAAGTLRTMELIANTQSTGANVAIVQCLYAKTKIGTGNSTTAVNINTRTSVAHFALDVSNTALSGANTSYVAIFQASNDGGAARSVRPTAFLGFMDQGNALSNGVNFLFDLGLGNSTAGFVNTTTSGAGAGVFVANSGITNAGCLAIRVNGVNAYIQLYSALAA